MSHAEQIEALKSLLERVRRANEPNRDLDREIHRALGFDMGTVLQDGTCIVPVWNAYTYSVDAALALMERVLPGWDAHIYRDDDDGGRFAAEMVWPPGTDIGEAGHYDMDGRHAPTRALAIVQGIIGSAEVLLSAKLALLTQEESR